ncbi:MAG: hypothetical protein ABR543_03815, partial [Gemmatimonadaceae bacterium]
MRERPGACVDLATVLDKELSYLHEHRHPNQTDRDLVKRSLVGLAMSGGGIRSATTNLGILQALARMRILPLVDYLSTVSGGGYIGACLSSLLSWNGNPPREWGDVRGPYTFAPEERPAFSTELEEFPFRPDLSEERPKQDNPLRPDPRASHDIIGHLRTHGNFLIARSGLFRRDSLRAVGTLAMGIAYNVGIFMLTLFAISAIYLAALLFLAPELPEVLSRSALPAAPLDTIRRDVDVVVTDSAIVRTNRTPGTCPRDATDCVTETAATLRSITVYDAMKRNARGLGDVFATEWKSWQLPESVQPLARWWSVTPEPFRPLLAGLGLGILTTIILFLWMSRAVRRYVRGQTRDGVAPTPGDSVEEAFERRVLRGAAQAMVGTVVVAIVLGQLLWRNMLSAEEQVLWLLVPLAVLTGAWVVTFICATLVFPRMRG